ATADQPARLFVIATVAQGSHVYSITQPKGIGPITTQIRLDRSEAFTQLGPFRAFPPPEKKPEPGFNNAIVEIHHGQVVWHAPIAPKADPRKLEITGGVYGQICTETGCLAPKNFPFVAHQGRGVRLPPEQLGAPSEGGPLPQIPEHPPQLPVDPAYPSVTPAAPGTGSLHWKPFTTIKAFRDLDGEGYDEETARENAEKQVGGMSIWWAVVFGFIGGITLNIMPCVLPVIGLKILSFVEQAGHDRRQALLLNIWYSLGLLSVFLVLATPAAFFDVGWSRQFQFPVFNITLVAVVFAMALSFLGVWEIPIPGFVGSGKSVEMTQKEGFAGAFSKGVITTILATPCTGPLMGSALAWAVSQPPLQTYVGFASVGLGMASPYLLIGAFPKLIAFLPKPGAWMDTFKQIMGFVLLGTVVYIFSFLQWSYVVPTVGLLFALWAGCWWVGRTPVTVPPAVKLQAWLSAAVFVGLAWLFMFPGLAKIAPGRWYSLPGLQTVMAERFDTRVERKVAEQIEQQYLVPGDPESKVEQKFLNTVMIDFTADWCPNCKVLENTILNTDAVAEAARTNGVVALRADWTDRESPEVSRMLEMLASKQVPVLAIYPAGDPNSPIVMRDSYTVQMVVDAINRAGPSREKE
ncbi:MAG: thioredoxin family protein, partial [Planctomycetes bacterium]|nr:thioredoxin family protein [Planctomycetota bacterium]